MPQLDTVIADFNIGIKGKAKLDQVIKTMKENQQQADKAEKGSMEWMETQNKLAFANKKFGDELNKVNKDISDFNKNLDGNTKGVSNFGGPLSSLAKTVGAALGAIFEADKSLQFGKELLKIEKQYNVLFKNTKLSAQDFIHFVVQEVRGSIFNDKLLDTVKELQISLRELTKAQVDALKPLGEDFNNKIIKDLQEGRRSTIQIFTDIMQKAKEAGLNTQQLQALVADLGKVPLEDLSGLGEAFVQIREAMEINLETTDDLGKRQKALLKASGDLADQE